MGWGKQGGGPSASAAIKTKRLQPPDPDRQTGSGTSLIGPPLTLPPHAQHVLLTATALWARNVATYPSRQVRYKLVSKLTRYPQIPVTYKWGGCYVVCCGSLVKLQNDASFTQWEIPGLPQ